MIIVDLIILSYDYHDKSIESMKKRKNNKRARGNVKSVTFSERLFFVYV